MSVGRKQRDKERGGRLRKKKQGEGQEGEGVANEQKKRVRLETKSRPETCFKNVKK